MHSSAQPAVPQETRPNEVALREKTPSAAKLVMALQELRLPIKRNTKAEKHAALASSKPCKGPYTPKENRRVLVQTPRLQTLKRMKSSGKSPCVSSNKLALPIAHSVEECISVPQETPSSRRRMPASSYGLPEEMDFLAVLPVYLHVYDASQQSAIQNLNGFFASKNSPLKFGGVFHVGVEVDGLEWSFGWVSSGTGVFCCEPLRCSQHHYRETLPLRCTHLSLDETAAVIRALEVEYQGADYDILSRNCCHFAKDLCERLGVGPLPRWLDRFAYIGDCIDQAALRLTKVPILDRAQQTRAEDPNALALCGL
jgi:hypothetical protein